MIMIKFNVERILGSVFTVGSTVIGFSISTKKIKNVIQKELKIVHMLQPKIYHKRKRNSI